jgi:hypothetical protein
MITQNATAAKEPNDRAKFISAMAYYTTDAKTGEISSGYKKSVDTIISVGGLGVGAGTTMNMEASGKTQTGLDRNGNEIEFTNITYKIADRNTNELIARDTSQAIRVAVKLQDGRTIVLYPMGYTISGQKSPDENYPY